MVHGGSGYTEHFPASQYLRDARITMIYEGANGIQALDLVGRKLPQNGGRAIMSWFGDIDAYVAEHGGNEAVKPFIDGLAESKKALQDGTMWLMQNGMANPENAGAAASDYMHLFGITGLAFGWRLIAKAALAKKDSGDPFYTAKLATARFYYAKLLPETAGLIRSCRAGLAPLMEMDEALF